MAQDIRTILQRPDQISVEVEGQEVDLMDANSIYYEVLLKKVDGRWVYAGHREILTKAQYEHLLEERRRQSIASGISSPT